MVMTVIWMAWTWTGKKMTLATLPLERRCAPPPHVRRRPITKVSVPVQDEILLVSVCPHVLRCRCHEP